MKYIVWIFITKNWMWQRCLLIIFACQWIVSHGTRCVLCAVSFPSIDLDLECFVALAVVDDINYPEWGSIPKIYEWIKSILAGKLCRAAPTGGNRGEPGGDSEAHGRHCFTLELPGELRMAVILENLARSETAEPSRNHRKESVQESQREWTREMGQPLRRFTFTNVMTSGVIIDQRRRSNIIQVWQLCRPNITTRCILPRSFYFWPFLGLLTSSRFT